jgi:hypothetical protein
MKTRMAAQILQCDSGFTEESKNALRIKFKIEKSCKKMLFYQGQTAQG